MSPEPSIELPQLPAEESLQLPPKPAPPHREEPPRSHKGRNFTLLLIAALLVLGGWWRISETRRAAAEKAAGPAKGGAPVPVVLGTVTQKDVPVYLDGLGTIQALNTVTVKARVDGQIEKILFQEGQDVKEGDVLAQIDAAPFKAALDQAQAKQRQDEVQLGNAKRDLQRDTDLIKKNVIAPQQFDYQQAQAAQFEAAVKNDAAAVASAQVQLAYTTIRSPLNGRTGLRQVDQGNIVHAADTNGIVVITQLQPIALIFTLPEQNLSEIHTEQEKSGPLKILAIARDNKTILAEGKLTVIDNQIDPTTGTIRLKGEFLNTDNHLWPGQFVNARLLVRTHTGGLTVPASVVQRGPDKSFAYVIKEDQTAEMRPIKVAQVDSGEALITEGLQAGEKVVVDGQYKLQPGAKVRPADAPGHAGGARPGGHEGPRPAKP